MCDTEPQSVRDVLVAARELIEDPMRWCQKTYALNAAGESVGEQSDTACRWCSDGALMKAARYGEDDGLPDEYDEARELLGSCARSLGATHIVSLNDSTDHPTVLRAFDCAIAKASE